MKTIHIRVNEKALDKVLYLLWNLPKNDVEIIEYEDFDYIDPKLEKEIEEMVKKVENWDHSDFISLEECQKRCIK